MNATLPWHTQVCDGMCVGTTQLVSQQEYASTRQQSMSGAAVQRKLPLPRVLRRTPGRQRTFSECCPAGVIIFVAIFPCQNDYAETSPQTLPYESSSRLSGAQRRRTPFQELQWSNWTRVKLLSHQTQTRARVEFISDTSIVHNTITTTNFLILRTIAVAIAGRRE